MLSLDKIIKGVSEVRESGGIESLGDNVRASVGNLRNSVTAGVTAGVGNLRDSVTAGVDKVSTIGRRGNRSNLFSTPSLVSTRPMPSISSATSKQKVRPGKLSLYVKNISTKKISVPIKCVGTNIKSTLENILRSNIEGKCSIEGYIKQRSCNIITYSSGLVAGSIAIFTVIYECLVCNPSQGMRISCNVKNITNAGILARVDDSESSPVNIFIARDHHYSIPYFSELKEGDDIMIRVIGQRFELNDPFVSILGELELEHQREPRNSIRREIERTREDKQKETGAGILSTIFEGIGISQPSQKSTSDEQVGQEEAIGAESGAENQENANEVPEETEEGGDTAAVAAAAEETEEAVVAGAAAEGGENEQ
jgi:DNA-directed RNA polymerase subunit E'/Rpb7